MPYKFPLVFGKMCGSKKKFRAPTPSAWEILFAWEEGWGEGVRGLVPLFYFAVYLETPLPHLDPRMGSDGTQVLLINVIYPQQVSNPSYFIITWSLKKKHI